MRAILLLLLLVWPAGAAADIRGRWESDRGPLGMVIEVGDNGDARIEPATTPGAYILLRGTEAFHIYRLADGTSVAVRPADMRQLVLERHGRSPGQAASAGTRAVAGPREVVGGRSGISYGLEGDPRVRGAALLVLSDDSSLAPLGRAFAVGIELGMAYNQLLGGRMDPAMLPMFRMMQSGTVLRFGSMVLVAVSRDRIDPARFALPGEPLSIERLRAGAAAPWVPADPVS